MERKTATWKISPKNRQWWCGDVDRTIHQWLSSSSRKEEVEGFILAAQNQSLATQMYRTKILKNGADPKCQLCTHSEETINRIISGCPIIVNAECLQRYDWVAKCIHWTLCKHYEIPHTEKRYKHTLKPVVKGKM